MIRSPRPNEKLTDIIKKIGRKKLVSLELNPYQQIDFLAVHKFKPSFCSIIWMAERNEPENPKLLKPVVATKELIRLGYTVLIHIPGIFYTKRKMRTILSVLKEYGVRNIFAMRGGVPNLKIEDCDFPFARDVISFIKNEFENYFDIVITGFPNIHPCSSSMEDEMLFLRQKVSLGANIILTQACWNSRTYLKFRNICTQYAIDIPIICGLLLFRSRKDLRQIKEMSLFVEKSESIIALQGMKQEVGRHFARNRTKYLVQELLRNEMTVGLHIFSKNHLDLIQNILDEIGVSKYKADLGKYALN